MSSGAALADAGGQTVDAFLGGLVTLVQPERGHRAGLDAALLQAVVPAGASGQAVDLGAGPGTIAFCIAARAPLLTVTAIEWDAELVGLARAALLRNENARFRDRVRMIQADVAAVDLGGDRPELLPGCADWVLMNPPFDAPGRVRESPEPRRRQAHVAEHGSLALWCRVAAGLLKPGGFLGLIHRAAELPALLAALDRRFGDLRILPVHPTAAKPAKRIVVRGKLGSRSCLQILPGLVLHGAAGAWTDKAEALLRGQADLGD